MANIKFSALPAAATPTGTETTVGLQSAAAVQFSPYVTQPLGDASLNLATMQALAQAIQPLNPASSVLEATTTILPNTPTYNNGTAGVGATLTAGANAALSIDSTVTILNGRYLVKNQASAFQNGIYTLTQVGTGSVPWILTRATDYNSISNINSTGTVPVIAGTVNALTNWLLVSTIPAVGSPNSITYSSQNFNKNAAVCASPLTQFATLYGGGGLNVVPAPSLGTAGQAWTSNGAGVAPTFQNIAATVNVQTSSYQLVLADANNIVAMQVTGAGTLTIPANGTVAFPVGTIVDVLNIGTGTLTVAITTDTLNIGSGGTLVAGSILLPVGATVSLLKTASTAWLASSVPATFSYGAITPVPAAANFSWINQNSSTATQTGGAGTPIAIFVPNDATQNWSVFAENIPSTPFTITMAIVLPLQNVNSSTIGLYFYDGTKLYGLEILQQSSAYKFRVQKITNVTTDGSTAASIFTTTFFNGPIYIRLSDDATNLKFYWSIDGYNFNQLFSEAVGTYMTPTKIGFGGFCDGNATGIYFSVMSWGP